MGRYGFRLSRLYRQQPGRRSRNILVYCLLFLGFLISWCLLTIFILFAEEKILGSSNSQTETNIDRDSYVGRGIQLVVGHYNGNLPAERRANLTDDELNANNFNPIDGFGEGGRAVQLLPREELEAENTFGINQFNIWISDRIALNRSLPDVRKPNCRAMTYPLPTELPTTSVIIVYHNEAYSTLLRTVTSVIIRTPKEVLKEIILVDDFSSRKFLKEDLEETLRELPIRTKLIRAKSRVGLIRARLMGAQEAEGEVLTFLDSHCECTTGWIEPLLARIKENRKAVVCPIIDVINDRTFAYQKGIELFRGGFNWNLQFRWYSVPSHVVRSRASNPTAPIDSPVMAGGLFSIDKQYFEELGTYDSRMDIWGGENIEISFRIWQCGGRVEILPCSHVGHIFRKASPHDFPKGQNSGSILNENLARAAEVWMDEWKYLFYKTAPQAAKIGNTTDISGRIELRKTLRCKDFNWFLTNVWPEHFLPTPRSKLARISHMRHQQCILSRPKEVGKHAHRLDLVKCSLGESGQLKSDEHQCLSATRELNSKSQWTVQLKECGEFAMEYWDYNKYYHTFMHRESGLCLDEPVQPIQVDSSQVQIPTLRKCQRGLISQQWKIMLVDWLPEDFLQ
uniref:Polypeptide N-acetylgalactosaminyltransferase n=1 Tax=Acrobeloides nanus TaxID=290746 RepID=A0A914CE23_9BILA